MTSAYGAPPPIPYAGHHDGPRRVLVLNARRGMIAAASVTVNIDGATYPQPWGPCAFEIPADRPVSVSVYQAMRGNQAGLAMTVLGPQDPAVLEYRGPAHLSRPGEIGPPGTVRQRGVALLGSLFGCLGILVLLLVLIIVFIFTSLT